MDPSDKVLSWLLDSGPAQADSSATLNKPENTKGGTVTKSEVGVRPASSNVNNLGSVRSSGMVAFAATKGEVTGASDTTQASNQLLSSERLIDNDEEEEEELKDDSVNSWSSNPVAGVGLATARPQAPPLRPIVTEPQLSDENEVGRSFLLMTAVNKRNAMRNSANSRRSKFRWCPFVLLDQTVVRESASNSFVARIRRASENLANRQRMGNPGSQTVNLSRRPDSPVPELQTTHTPVTTDTSTSQIAADSLDAAMSPNLSTAYVQASLAASEPSSPEQEPITMDGGIDESDEPMDNSAYADWARAASDRSPDLPSVLESLSEPENVSAMRASVLDLLTSPFGPVTMEAVNAYGDVDYEQGKKPGRDHQSPDDMRESDTAPIVHQSPCPSATLGQCTAQPAPPDCGLSPTSSQPPSFARSISSPSLRRSISTSRPLKRRRRSLDDWALVYGGNGKYGVAKRRSGLLSSDTGHSPTELGDSSPALQSANKFSYKRSFSMPVGL